MKTYALTARLIAALLTATLLAACSSSTKLNEVPVESRTPTGTSPANAAAGGAGTSATTAATTPNSRVTTVDTMGKTAGNIGRIVYFDYDSFVLRDEFKPLVDAHAKTLVSSRAKRIIIEGHTDERGGREYNLALGQKRAEAVLRNLVLLGALDNQIESVSFGQERPAVTGIDEASWAKNRRAELRDK